MSLHDPGYDTGSANPHVVTAVLVAHDGARWLPETLDGLLGQTRPVQRVVAVDTGSRDRGPQLLAAALGPANVFTLPRDTGYGAAVVAALRHPAANTPVGHPDDPRAEYTEWIWLIHDDSAPDAMALQMLLRAAEEDRFATVIGPKVRDWHDHRLLVEAGVTIDGAGRRETGLERRELDQGQHDNDQEVLAVGSAGMLIRRDVWEQLGGFDPNLPLFRDDIDFCWRANAAGYRVRLTTRAIVHHAEASARRRRRISATSDHPRRVDRRNALYVLFANLPTGALLVAMIRNLFGSLLRALLYLAGKQPANAWDEIAAIGYVFGNPGRLLRARRRRARDRSRTYSAIRPYMAKGVAMRRLVDMVNGLLSGGRAGEPAGGHRAVTGAPIAEDDEELLSDSGVLRRVFTHPGVLLALALAALTLVAERNLFGPGWIGGGALVPLDGGASDLWQEYLRGFHDVGVGSAASAPPYVAVLAALSTIFFGKTWLAVTVLLLGCIPLAGVAAYLAARKVVASVPAQLWMAASYALLPVATGAVAAGRIGTAMVFALLPVIGIMAGRMLTLPPRRARRAAWAVGLLLAVAMAFVPLVWVLALIVGGLAWLAFGKGRRQTGLSIAIALLTPPVLLLPWTGRLFAHPSMFLLEAGLHRPELADARLPAGSLLLLNPGGPGVPPEWVTAGFLLAGLAALVLRRRRMFVAIGWGVALFGLLIAILVSRVEVAPVTGGPATPAWPGVALAFVATGVLLAAATAAQSMTELVRAGGARRLAALLMVAIACVTPIAAAAVWITTGVRGPISRHEVDVVPPFLAAASQTGARVRTLVLRPRPDSSLTYTVLRGRTPQLGEPQLPLEESARRRLDEVVAGIGSGRGGDDAADLAHFAIAYVLLPAPIRPDTVRLLDASPGLRRVSITPSFALWRAGVPTARVRVLGPPDETGVRQLLQVVSSGRIEVHGARIEPGPAGRTLALAEPFDGDWRAELDGRPLTPVRAPVAGFAQGFQLPESGGSLELTRGTLLRDLAVSAQGLLALVVVIFALPGARIEEDEEEVVEPGERKRERPAGRRSRGHRSRVGRVEPAGVGADSRRDPGDDLYLDETEVEPPAPLPREPVGPGVGRVTDVLADTGAGTPGRGMYGEPAMSAPGPVRPGGRDQPYSAPGYADQHPDPYDDRYDDRYDERHRQPWERGGHPYGGNR